MPFGIYNASSTFQRGIARALQKMFIVKNWWFHCLREACFKMKTAKCDLWSRIKNTWSVWFLPKVWSLTPMRRDWAIPCTETELQSFFGLVMFYRGCIPSWHATLVDPLQTVTGQNTTFAWGPEQQQAFNENRLALIETTILAQPNTKGEFVHSDILQHLWRSFGQRRLRPILDGSKKMTATQAMYGYPNYKYTLHITSSSRSTVTFVRETWG